jgi:hypothetical protein
VSGGCERKHVPIAASKCHQKALSPYEDFSKWLPETMTPRHLVQARDSYTASRTVVYRFWYCLWFQASIVGLGTYPHGQRKLL